MVVAGFPHGPCIDKECPYFDAEAAAELDRRYAEDMAASRARLIAMACQCKRCVRSRKDVSDELLEEIVFHLLRVLKPAGIRRWFHTTIPALNDNPVGAFEQGRISEVVAVVRSYEDPSFS